MTDVVLNGKYQQAKSLGIQFDSEFLFPSDYGIDVFDLSIILNNALNNALEACEVLSGSDPEVERFISVTSYCKNNMFLIEVKNSFDGTVCVTEDGDLRAENRIPTGMGWDFRILCGARTNIWAAPIIPAVTGRLR